MSIADLEAQMAAAAGRQDFEEARRLRDLIVLARQTGADPATLNVDGLTRQRNGAMGIGSNQPVPSRPAGWTPPRKPDPMTRGRSR